MTCTAWLLSTVRILCCVCPVPDWALGLATLPCVLLHAGMHTYVHTCKHARMYACPHADACAASKVARGRGSCWCTFTVVQAAAKHPTCMLQSGRHTAVLVGHWCMHVTSTRVHSCLVVLPPGVLPRADSVVPNMACECLQWGVAGPRGPGQHHDAVSTADCIVVSASVPYTSLLRDSRRCCRVYQSQHRFDCRPGSRALSTLGLGWAGGASAWGCGRHAKPWSCCEGRLWQKLSRA